MAVMRRPSRQVFSHFFLTDDMGIVVLRKIKHGDGFGLHMRPKHAMVQDGLGKVKTNHEKGFGFFKVPKSGERRVWGSVHTSTTLC